MIEGYVQPNGSLIGAGNPYIEWQPGAKWVEIDGYLTPEDLIELALYIAEKEGIDLYRL